MYASKRRDVNENSATFFISKLVLELLTLKTELQNFIIFSFGIFCHLSQIFQFSIINNIISCCHIVVEIW